MKTTTTILLFLCVTLSVTFNMNAQNDGVLLNPFVGVGGNSGSDKVQTPSFGVSAEFFLDETFSIGAIATYSTIEATTTFLQDDDGTTDGFTIGALVNYYWTESDTFNFYTGGSLGYDGHSGPYVDGTIYYEFHAGGRYQLSENFGLYAELGYGLALLKAGVSVKL